MILALLGGVILFLLTITLLVVFHEYGHFIVARCFGVGVECFSVGFGKALWKHKNKKGTEYRFAMIPLGGYVKLRDEKFNERSVWVRSAIILAGPLASLLLAVLLYWIIFAVGYQETIPLIGKIIPHSSAEQVNLKPNNEIIAINKKPVSSWTDIYMMLIPYIGETGRIEVTVKQWQQKTISTYQLQLPPWNNSVTDVDRNPLSRLGIEPYLPTDTSLAMKREVVYKLLPALIAGMQRTGNITQLSFSVLGKMAQGYLSLRGISGPLGIAENAFISAKAGVIHYLNFLALLTISLGVLNLLPIPLLDGGHIFYYLVELVRGRPLSLRAQLMGFRIGASVLLILMLVAAYNDLTRLWG